MNTIRPIFSFLLILFFLQAYAQELRPPRLDLELSTFYEEGGQWEKHLTYTFYKETLPGSKTEVPRELKFKPRASQVRMLFSTSMNRQPVRWERLIVMPTDKNGNGSMVMQRVVRASPGGKRTEGVVDYSLQGLDPYEQLVVDVQEPVGYLGRIPNQTLIVEFSGLKGGSYTVQYFVQMAAAKAASEPERKRLQKYISNPARLEVRILPQEKGESLHRYAIGPFDTEEEAGEFQRGLIRNWKEYSYQRNFPPIRQVAGNPTEFSETEIVRTNRLTRDYDRNITASGQPPVGNDIPGLTNRSSGATTSQSYGESFPYTQKNQNLYAIELYTTDSPPSIYTTRRLAGLNGVTYFEKDGNIYRVRIGFFNTLYEATEALAKVRVAYPAARVIQEAGHFVNADMHPSARPARPDTSSGKEFGAGAARPVYHTVKEGETLYSIARQYEVSVGQIQELNNLERGEVILPFQRLRIQ